MVISEDLLTCQIALCSMADALELKNEVIRVLLDFKRNLELENTKLNEKNVIIETERNVLLSEFKKLQEIVMVIEE